MKNYPRLHKPEEYRITEDDINNSEEFSSLLNHLTNVVVSEPLHKISLKNIGIGNQKAMVYIEHLDSPNKYVPVLCEINAGVDLWDNRGIHMSRLVQSIFTLSQKKFKTLDEFAMELAKDIQQNQERETAFVEVKGTYIHKRFTKKSALESYDTIYLLSNVTASKDFVQLKTGMIVSNATACPCTKAFTKYSVVPELKSMGLTFPQIQKVLDITIPATHMQIGPTTLLIDNEKYDITHKQLYYILDKSLHLVYDLLKRDDEHDFVKTATERPQFTEDAAREVAYNAYQTFNKVLSPKAELFVLSLLQDSIHTHDVRTLIQNTFGDITKELSE